MLPIVLFSHGNYSQATKETAEMIVGDLEEVYTLAIKVGSSISEAENDLEGIVQKYNGNIIVLCDILGGTPSNITFKLKQKYKDMVCYTGFNLPLVLELIFNRSGETKDIKEMIRTTYSEGLHEIEYIELRQDNDSFMDL